MERSITTANREAAPGRFGAEGRDYSVEGRGHHSKGFEGGGIKPRDEGGYGAGERRAQQGYGSADSGEVSEPQRYWPLALAMGVAVFLCILSNVPPTQKAQAQSDNNEVKAKLNSGS